MRSSTIYLVPAALFLGLSAANADNTVSKTSYCAYNKLCKYHWDIDTHHTKFIFTGYCYSEDGKTTVMPENFDCRSPQVPITCSFGGGAHGTDSCTCNGKYQEQSYKVNTEVLCPGA